MAATVLAGLTISPTPPPSWARHITSQPFKEHAPLLTLDRAILLNTPFVGRYIATPQNTIPPTQDTALAVFARFDTTITPARLYLAVREIHTAPRPQDGRRTSLTWVPFNVFWRYVDKYLMGPRTQVFVPKRRFADERGALDRERIRREWDLEMARIGTAEMNGNVRGEESRGIHLNR